MKDNRQMPFKADKPYNELPPLPPKQEVETRAVLKKCITARAALAEHKDDYYDNLLGVTSRQSWEQWILYVLNSVEDTAVWTREKIRAIRMLLEHTNQYVRSTKPDLHSRELVDVIFSQPYCRIGNLVDAGIAKRQTASVYLKKLVEIGVLREIRVGREKLFVNPKLIGVITTSNDFRDYS